MNERANSPEPKSAVPAALLALVGAGGLGFLFLRTGGLESPAAQMPPASGPSEVDPDPTELAAAPELPAGYSVQVEHGRTTLRGPVMGTTFSLVRVGEVDAPERWANRVEASLEAVNAEMSTYIESSVLSRFNGGEHPLVVSEAFAEALEVSRAVWTHSDGAFDPTVGPLVRAWGFGPDERPSQPPEIEDLRALIGFDEIVLTRREDGAWMLDKTREGVELDLSAVAKGLAAERLCRELGPEGSVMVEVGGEVCVRGASAPGRPWRLGVERPNEKVAPGAAGVQRIVALDGDEYAALATSGDYRNYYEVDGKRLSHTIDPRSGRPIEHRLASVSVVASDASSADAWATALNVMGLEAGWVLARERGLAAYFIARTDEGGFEERLTPEFATLSTSPPGDPNPQTQP